MTCWTCQYSLFNCLKEIFPGKKTNFCSRVLHLFLGLMEEHEAECTVSNENGMSEDQMAVEHIYTVIYDAHFGPQDMSHCLE